MAKATIRFGVFDDKGNRAATWNISASEKSNGAEIYLSCRELGGAIHTSFHKSGYWHTAYDNDFFEANIEPISSEGVTRYIEKWTRPPEIKPGITLVFKIIVAHAAVNTPVETGGKAVSQIPAPPLNRAVQVLILLIDAGQKLQINNLSRVDEITFSDGSKLVVGWSEVDSAEIIEPGSANVQMVKGKTKEELESANIRILAFSVDQGGNRLIVELVNEVSETADKD